MNRILSIGLVFAPVAAFAAQGNRHSIDFSQPLMADGKAIHNPQLKTGDDCYVETFGCAASRALLLELPEDRTSSAPQKLQRYDLAQYIHRHGIDNPKALLSSSEIALLDDRVGRMFPRLVAAQIIEVIDPNFAKQHAPHADDDWASKLLK